VHENEVTHFLLLISIISISNYGRYSEDIIFFGGGRTVRSGLFIVLDDGDGVHNFCDFTL